MDPIPRAATTPPSTQRDPDEEQLFKRAGELRRMEVAGSRDDPQGRGDPRLQ